MKIRFAALAILTVFGSAPIQASTKSEARVKAAKGPVQITLRLHKTTVKAGKSVWYQLVLKNIGKKKIRVEDSTFKDPWAIYENSNLRNGIYLEIIDAKGKPLRPQRGGERVRFDYEPEPGKSKPLGAKDTQERNAFEAALKKRGFSEQDEHIAMSRWDVAWNERKRNEELIDPARKLWLKPGASTTTIAWAYRDMSQYPDHSEEEPQVGDYTQLWTYHLSDPGTYRIRAVYDFERIATYGYEIEKKYNLKKQTPQDWWIKVKTPFINFVVVP